MASSGTITGTAGGSSGITKPKPWVKWTLNSQNVGNNTSSITVKFGFDTAGSYFWGTFTGTLTINGTAYSIDESVSSSSPGTIISKTVTISHASDGSKTVAIKVTGGVDGTSSWSSTSLSGTAVLTTIPRATAPTLSDTSFDAGDTVTVKLAPASSSFTHTLTWSFGSASGTIATKTSSKSISWATVLSTLCAQMTTGTSKSGTLTCETFSGSTSIGSKSISFTAKVPSSVVPSIASITVTDTSGALTSIGAWIQNISKAKTVINTPAGIYGSTIKSYKVTVSDQTGTAATTTLSITKSGSLTLTATVTDSRGRTASETQTLTVLAYTPPDLTQFTVTRVTSAGVAADLGTYIKVVAKGTAKSLIVSSVEKNTLTWGVKYRKTGNTTWINLTVTQPAALTLNASPTLGSGAFLADDSWEVQVWLKDGITTIYDQVSVATGAVALSLAKKGIGVGKIWERGALDVAGDVYIDSAKLEMTPTKTDITSLCTVGTGWDLTGTVVVTTIGKLCQLYCSNVVRTGTAITVPDSGDISNQTLLTIPAAWRPLDSAPMSSVANGRAATGYLSINGVLVLCAVGGSANITTGSISLAGTYLLP